MNSGATFERVYDALKTRILANSFRPGERLDPIQLGSELHTSATPIRDALHLLSGEGLVESRLSDGFHTILIDAPSLQDLYGWNAEVLLLAIRSWPPGAAGIEDPPAETAAGIAAFFIEIARRSKNAEHRYAIASVNDRLHAARICESTVLCDIEDELAAMMAAYERDDRAGLRRLVMAFHSRRRRCAHELVRALYRQTDWPKNNRQIKSV